MADYRLSQSARYDLTDIAEYTYETYGDKQAERYGESLKNCFEKLARYRHLGRDASELSPNLRAFEFQAHVIYYMPMDADILIVRVLHHSRDAKRHL